MASVWEELKRRNVVKVAVAYAIVGWLSIEVSATLLPAFEAPDWVLRVFVLLIGLGFVLALVLSWAYELTAQGVVRSDDVAAAESITTTTGRKLDFIIIALMAAGIAFLVLDNYVLESIDEDPAAEEANSVVIEQSSDVLQNSIAVLPFENLSSDPENAFFAAGIHEETLNELAKLRNLSVISRTSVVRYANSELSIPQIADELNVETVLEGSVRYAAGRVRITAQLIEAATDEHLWSEVYERDFADIFAIQSDIAMNIANAMQAEFSLEEQANLEKIPTDSPQAYALYLQASSLVTGPGQPVDVSRAALDMLQQALALDPEFALAYVKIARIMLLYQRVVATGGLASSQARARTSVEKALAIDPTIGLAYGIFAIIHMGNWDAFSAQAAFDKALELSPNDPLILEGYAMFSARMGNFADAKKYVERAVALGRGGNTTALIRILAGDYEGATAWYEQSVVARPGSPLLRLELSRLASRRGDYEEAIRQLRVAEKLGGAATGQMYAYAYKLAGSHADAQRLKQEYERQFSGTFVPSMMRALGHLAVGENELALEQIRIAASNPGENLLATEAEFIRVNAFADPTLDQPAFVEVRKLLGFRNIPE